MKKKRLNVTIIKQCKKKKKVNFDDVIKENIKNIMQISHKFLIIYTEY